MDQNGYLLACSVWERGTMPVLRGPRGGGLQPFLVVLCRCLDICGVLIFVGVLISQYFWELMSEVVSSVECPLPCLRVCWCSLVGVSGKWIIGEDLLPREMTVTHEPNGTEYFPAYCAGAVLFHPWTHFWYLIWNRMYTFPHTVLVILSSLSHPWCIFNLI